MTTRDELVAALARRYALCSRADRGRILNEFAALTGHHRKHAMRLLRAGVSSGRSNPLKIWRRDKAHEFVFGATPVEDAPMPVSLLSIT